ncbi:hypothetical protein AcV5_002772 [Taiwanofungus camphoratus]|nr:hypothetical protein AcV5_002772 [Antrodia cinnamomea]KAI0929764.1 hypothetical protein AcV7_005222 [Antrodia cinnamomea]
MRVRWCVAIDNHTINRTLVRPEQQRCASIRLTFSESCGYLQEAWHLGRVRGTNVEPKKPIWDSTVKIIFPRVLSMSRVTRLASRLVMDRTCGCASCPSSHIECAYIHPEEESQDSEAPKNKLVTAFRSYCYSTPVRLQSKKQQPEQLM